MHSKESVWDVEDLDPEGIRAGDGGGGSFLAGDGGGDVFHTGDGGATFCVRSKGLMWSESLLCFNKCEDSDVSWEDQEHFFSVSCLSGVTDADLDHSTAEDLEVRQKRRNILFFSCRLFLIGYFRTISTNNIPCCTGTLWNFLLCWPFGWLITSFSHNKTILLQRLMKIYVIFTFSKKNEEKQ